MNGTRYDDPDCGPLVWESVTTAWVGRFQDAELRIAALPRYMEISDAARATFLRLPASELTARQYACEKLLPLYNESWNEGSPIDAPRFLELVTLDSLSIDDDGSATFSYRDGNLFAGHLIIASADPDGDLFDAVLCG
jgi:hypothetical protein